jgi:hypothetical protein
MDVRAHHASGGTLAPSGVRVGLRSLKQIQRPKVFGIPDYRPLDPAARLDCRYGGQADRKTGGIDFIGSISDRRRPEVSEPAICPQDRRLS